jgi:lysine-specific demethylase/histidyl-hydroxylase NO66
MEQEVPSAVDAPQQQLGGPALLWQVRRNFNSNSKAETEEANATVVDPDMAWANYEDGCSLRVLHPQRWSPVLAARLAALEELFCSCVGCNAYLTPPGAKARTPAKWF